MKRIVAISSSPRSGWNKDLLVRKTAAGVASTGAEVVIIDLYKLEHLPAVCHLSAAQPLQGNAERLCLTNADIGRQKNGFPHERQAAYQLGADMLRK